MTEEKRYVTRENFLYITHFGNESEKKCNTEGDKKKIANDIASLFPIVKRPSATAALTNDNFIIINYRKVKKSNFCINRKHSDEFHKSSA